MNGKHKSSVMIRARSALETILPEFSDSRLLYCRILDSCGPYMHVEVQYLDDETLTAELLIPHADVLWALTSSSRRTFGFAPKERHKTSLRRMAPLHSSKSS